MNVEEISVICRRWGLEIEAASQEGAVLILSPRQLEEGRELDPVKMKALSEELRKEFGQIRYVTLHLEDPDGR